MSRGNLAPDRFAGRFWPVIFLFSVTLNLLLILRVVRQSGMEAATQKQRTFDQSPLMRKASALPDTKGAEETGVKWSDLSELDFKTLRSKLRAVRCPEEIANAIIEARIQMEYKPGLAALYQELQQDFWQDAVMAKSSRTQPPDPQQEKVRQKLSELAREKDTLLAEMFGRDWQDRQRRDQNRFGDLDSADPSVSFLSEENRARILRQRKEISELRNLLRHLSEPEEEANKRLESLKREQASERAGFLTPEELDEYAFRSSRHAYFGAELYGFAPTQEEYRAIAGLKEKYDEDKVPAEEFRELLGEDRFAQFERAQDRDFHPIYKTAAYLGIPEEAAIEVYGLKKKSEENAQSIRANRTLRREERGKALDALRSETEQRIAEHLPQSGLELYHRNGGWWIRHLGELQN